MIEQLITDLVQWFLGLFAPAEWKAMALIVLFTLAGTHTAKIALRLGPVRGGSHPQIYLASAAIAFAIAWFVWPGPVPWWIAGVIGGPAANISFWIGYAALKRFAPRAARGLNAERRRVWGLPPKGLPERRK